MKDYFDVFGALCLSEVLIEHQPHFFNTLQAAPAEYMPHFLSFMSRLVISTAGRVTSIQERTLYPLFWL